MWIQFAVVCLLGIQVLNINADQTVNNVDPRAFVTIGGRSYYISPADTEVTATYGVKFCNDVNMTLASFETLAEYTLVKDYLMNNGYQTEDLWTSGRKYGPEYQWTGSGYMITYFEWSPSEPNHTNNTDICIGMNLPSDWFDDDCDVLASFICEKN